MIYVTADIHGHLEKYQTLLEKINLSSKDALVILGDVVDRGTQSMEILQDIMTRDNVFLLKGNHEQIALACLRTLKQEITEDSIAKLDAATTDMLVEWLYNLGGEETLHSFQKLSKTQQDDILDFLEDLDHYEEFVIGGQNYLLVHASLDNFHPQKPLDDYTEDELIWGRIDYGMEYIPDTIIVTGHTPTRNIEGNRNPDHIYKANNHIAIDCGCGFPGGKLGCICLNTMEEFYV